MVVMFFVGRDEAGNRRKAFALDLVLPLSHILLPESSLALLGRFRIVLPRLLLCVLASMLAQARKGEFLSRAAGRPTF